MKLLAFLISLLLHFEPPSPPPADPFLGTWLSEDKDCRIEITRAGNVYTGRYLSFVDQATARKKGYVVGNVVLKDLKADGRELSGRVIDAETKKDYKSTLTPTDANHLLMKVKIMGVTGHSETWTRVTAAVPARK